LGLGVLSFQHPFHTAFESMDFPLGRVGGEHQLPRCRFSSGMEAQFGGFEGPFGYADGRGFLRLNSNV
jgi:hypothetical protein